MKPLAICLDHCGVVMVTRRGDEIRGPGYWKLNNSMLKDDYLKCNDLSIIQNAKRSLDRWGKTSTVWEFCKRRIKEFSLRYGKQMRKRERDELKLLEKQYEEFVSNNLAIDAKAYH